MDSCINGHKYSEFCDTAVKMCLFLTIISCHLLFNSYSQVKCWLFNLFCIQETPRYVCLAFFFLYASQIAAAQYIEQKEMLPITVSVISDENEGFKNVGVLSARFFHINPDLNIDLQKNLLHRMHSCRHQLKRV